MEQEHRFRIDIPFRERFANVVIRGVCLLVRTIVPIMSNFRVAPCRATTLPIGSRSLYITHILPTWCFTGTQIPASHPHIFCFAYRKITFFAASITKFAVESASMNFIRAIHPACTIELIPDDVFKRGLAPQKGISGLARQIRIEFPNDLSIFSVPFRSDTISSPGRPARRISPALPEHFAQLSAILSSADPSGNLFSHLVVLITRNMDYIRACACNIVSSW